MSVSTLLVVAAMMFQSGVDSTGTAIARPYGDVQQEETTGSYFQMFEFYGRPPHTWEHAQAMVSGYEYKGRPGRLAHIKTSAIHYFLLLNFPDLHSNKAWIGLGAECNEKADIMWADGSLLKHQSFRAWNVGTLKKISRTC
ncbi:MAG: C-type lectin domain-containing protein, partial [Kordiimonadaceae bacterium]|nr:C-type lectin domain-containing protein [Kordiimonadaceae bacterium]